MFFPISALEDRVNGNEVTLILHSEQLSVQDNSISLLDDQVNVLENTDSTQQESIEELEAADERAYQRFDELEMTINETLPANLTERVQTLENITIAQQKDIADLKATDTVHNNDISKLNVVDDGFEQRISQLEDGIINSNTSNPIEFHARLSNADLPVLPDPIIYGNVMVNVGANYDEDTGGTISHIDILFYLVISNQYCYIG